MPDNLSELVTFLSFLKLIASGAAQVYDMFILLLNSAPLSVKSNFDTLDPEK